MNPGTWVTIWLPMCMAFIVVAQQAARRREEEQMTDYSPGDLTGDWEFKIVRSTRAGFRKPERLREVLAEEAIAGWELVEKFDDSRIRLKRPTSRRQLDGKLEFDPYRTTVGTNEVLVVAIAAGAVLAVLLGFLVVARTSMQVAQPATVVSPPRTVDREVGPAKPSQGVIEVEAPRPPSVVIPSAR